MIELVWKDIYSSDYDAMMIVSNLLAWLCVEIAETERNKPKIKGYIVCQDDETTISTLIICNGMEDQNKILKILQDPPEEYKEKYVARIPCEEPNPVYEKTSSPQAELDENESSDEGET